MKRLKEAIKELKGCWHAMECACAHEAIHLIELYIKDNEEEQ